MAYAAVLSLKQNLEQISNPHLEQHQTPLQDQQIKSLQEKLSELLDFLDDSWQRRSKQLRCLEREIRDAAYKAEDMVESHISKNFGEEGFHERRMRDQTFCVDFEIVAAEIDFIKTKADKLQELWGSTDLDQSQRTSVPTGPSRLASMGKNYMVGFHKDLMEIMDRLTLNQASLQIIRVTGMGGIGKTTLARNVYNHPYIKDHFHIRAWVSISQEYREREVLLSLLDSMKRLNAEMRREKSTEELKDYLYKSLNGLRYLVVMDDVWNNDAWNCLRRIFPDDRIRSRIMLTTRLSGVVDSCSYSHDMKFLNKTDSWNLLHREVFGEDSCPLELEETGKEISKNCKGLPLSLVVIGGHLSKDKWTKDHWERAAGDVKSVVNAADQNCSEILSLSYDYLPHYLKACFLYMGVFPEDDEIRVSKLIKLWAAEGFLKPVRGKTLEEVAEEYLRDLISRNLILIRERSSAGKIKTCGIHDMLRDLCIRKAQDEKFFHIIGKDFNIFAEGIKYSRRLCIHSSDTFHKELSNCDNLNVYPSMGSLAPPVRSILCSAFASEIYKSSDGKLFPLLRVLDLKRKLGWDLIGEIKLVHSRYLSFSSKKIPIPKTLPDSLWFLQTLIVDCKEVHLPEEIWRIPQLRHLLFGRCYLPCPARSPIDGENLVLGNLLTLSKVSSSSCTKEVFEGVPNLNKLGILVEKFEMTPFFLRNLFNLHQLETLKIRSGIYSDVSVLMNLTFPPNIKKLTLEGCHIPWEYMTIVGSMPKLEVLKLQLYACHGPEWEPTEGDFCKLRFLLLHGMDLVQWKADESHFPSLEHLILRRCFKLEEIPRSIGYVPVLQIIDLDDASLSAVTSAERIQVEQKDGGNDSLHVRVIDKFHLKRVKQEKEKAQIMAGVWSNDDPLQLKATDQFCSLLFDSIQLSEELISGVVPRLVEFLARNDYPELQCKAAEAMTCISNGSSDNINIMIDHGAVPILVSLLSSPEDVLREQALHLLGNFAGDSTKSRDLILSYGVLMPLLAQFNGKTKLSIMRKGTRTLSNICQGKTWPQFKQVKSAIHPLARLIHTDDEEVLNSACWALLGLSYWKKDIIQAGVFPRLAPGRKIAIFEKKYSCIVDSKQLLLLLFVLLLHDDIRESLLLMLLVQLVDCEWEKLFAGRFCGNMR
ncbi:late blight resistance homolog R1A-3 isoform X1 [Olea europaea subsp. europaea]|uniref:Late blight resistance homolog R1A-3 isoform X1 n=1 Tax=Olea europaea subsp. europaea TaxID=158383 RepID=A0A8S0U5P7_OLEEU|nr:late blight resistance homolog R1A-3 isoform X1 [Olea europaea subsp. europaea]